MSQWPSTKTRSLLAALLHIGWSIKRETPVPTEFFFGQDGLTTYSPFTMG